MNAFDPKLWMEDQEKRNPDQKPLFEEENHDEAQVASVEYRRDASPNEALVRGSQSEVRITYDSERERNEEIPLICCSAPRGYVRLPSFIKDDPRRREILSVADWMTGAKSGAFVVTFPQAQGSEGLALIQSDHDGHGNDTYYQRHHRDSHGVWRDFYFRTVFTALKEGDALWGSDEIQIAHPINGGWDLELLTVVLDAIGHLVNQQRLNVKTIHLDCLHGLPGRELEDFSQALSTLIDEQTEHEGSGYREFEVERETRHFEAQHPGSDGALYWIRLERQDKDETIQV